MHGLFAALESVTAPWSVFAAVGLVIGLIAWRLPVAPTRRAVVVVVLGAGLFAASALGVGAVRYARNPEVLDVVEGQVLVSAVEAVRGWSPYDHDPAQRMVATYYGPATFTWWSAVIRVTGAQLAAVKLVNAVMVFAALLIFGFAVRAIVGLVPALVGVALQTTALAAMGPFFLTVRSDAPVLLLQSLALLGASRRRGSGLIVAGMAAGLLAGIKPHPALATILVVLVFAVDDDARASMRRAVGAVVASMVGFGAALWAGGSMTVAYLATFRAAAGALRLRPELVLTNFTIAGASAVLVTLALWRRWGVRGLRGAAVAAAFGGLLVVLVLGAVDGAFENHALEAMMLVIMLGALVWKEADASTQRMGAAWLSAVAVMFGLSTMRRLPSLVWQTAGRPVEAAAVRDEGIAMRRAAGDGRRVAVALGDDGAASYRSEVLRPALVMAGAHQVADWSALMLWRVAHPASTLDALPQSPQVDAWMLPQGAAAWTAGNWFEGHGRLLSPRAAERFAAEWRVRCTGTHWMLAVRATDDRPVPCAASR